MLKHGKDPTHAFPGERWAEVLTAEVARDRAATRKLVRGLGGLYVVGTERHEARRIDNQLRGRSGRLGDPGSSRFYLSLEDELMRRFGGDRIGGLMARLGVEDDVPIEAGLVNRAIENAQTKVEGYNFDIRKHVLRYDEVVNEQRNRIYDQRRRILTEPSLKLTVESMIEEEADESGHPVHRPASMTTSGSWTNWRRRSRRSCTTLPDDFGPEQLAGHEAGRDRRPTPSPWRTRPMPPRKRNWASRSCARPRSRSCSGPWTAAGSAT